MMKKELDEKLCANYPKIFRDRMGDPHETLMIWGFDCSDGWYDILDNMCFAIQQHIDWERKRRAGALRYNRALKRCAQTNDMTYLRYYFAGTGMNEEWVDIRIKKLLEDPNTDYRKVPEVCPQVVAVQVKEKYGTLNFYHTGGDAYTDGVMNMAEQMSACTCEICGDRGSMRGDNWMTVRCDKHKENT
jgi:hypothetical protein